MPKSRFASVVVAVAALMTAGPAWAAQVVLSPVVDAQAETQNGTTWTVDTASDSLNASRFQGLALERRGIAEYSLAAIPAGSRIDSASIRFDINTFTEQTGNVPPVIIFNGYPGEGAATVADATRPLMEIGRSPDITDLTTYTAPLSASFIQSILNAGPGTALGLLTTQGTQNLQAAFYSTEFAPLAGTIPAQITINYTVPEPGAIGLVLCGAAGLFLRRRRVS
jgi:hypothetical protein